jgi:hypothetical protein
VTVWAHDDTQRGLLLDRWGSTARRLHFVAAGAAVALHSTRLFEYSFAPEAFEPWADAEGQWVAAVPVRPLAVRPVGDLVAAHAAAGVELRFEPDLAARREEVLASGLPFSIVRWSRRAGAA